MKIFLCDFIFVERKEKHKDVVKPNL